jgi:hypothetical protein
MAEKGLSFWQAPFYNCHREVQQFNGEGENTMKTVTSEKHRRRPKDAAISYELDWLALAIGDIGGADGDMIRIAARELGITRQKVVSILEHGAGSLTFSQVADLSRRARIPMELFRMGPPSAANLSGRGNGECELSGKGESIMKTAKSSKRKAANRSNSTRAVRGPAAEHIEMLTAVTECLVEKVREDRATPCERR